MVGAFKNDADDIRLGKPKVKSIMNNAEIQATLFVILSRESLVQCCASTSNS
jgi:hypothetical protein